MTARLLVLAVLAACGKGGDPPAKREVVTEGETVQVPTGAKDGSSVGTQPVDNPAFHLRPEEGTLTIAPAEAPTGSVATAMVKVTPAAGFHVSTEFGIKLALEPPAGVTLEKPVMTAGGRRKLQGDAHTLSEKELVFEVHATAAKPGTYEIPGRFDFGVCEGDACHMKNQPVTIVVAAK